MKYQVLLTGVVVSIFLFVASAITQHVTASPYGYGKYGSCKYQACTIAIETSSAVSLPVTPTDAGVYTVAEDNVEVTTNSSRGYTLALSSSSPTEDGLVGDSDVIENSSGTTASPIVLASNSWGFRVDGFDGFGMGPTTAINSQPTSSLTFAGVPLLGSPVIFNTTDEEAPLGDSNSVWYGVHVNNTIAADTYMATVVYTATMNP